MDSGVEEPLAPALGTLTGARILWDVGEHTRRDPALPLVRNIKAAIQLERGTAAVHPDLFGHRLQRVPALRQPPPVGLMDGRHGDGRSHRALLVNAGDDFGPLLRLVARGAHALAPGLATGWVPSPWSPRVARRGRQRPPARAERRPEGAIVGPGGQDWVDGRVMD